MTDKLEEMIGDIYKSLTVIEVNEGIRIDSKAFIADFLSRELIKLGYRKVNPLEEEQDDR